MRLQGNNAQKPQNVYNFDLTFSPMIHMTSFLFHAGSWVLRDAVLVLLQRLQRTSCLKCPYLEEFRLTSLGASQHGKTKAIEAGRK